VLLSNFNKYVFVWHRSADRLEFYVQRCTSIVADDTKYLAVGRRLIYRQWLLDLQCIRLIIRFDDPVTVNGSATDAADARRHRDCVNRSERIALCSSG